MKCEVCGKSREKISRYKNGEKWYCRRCHNSMIIGNKTPIITHKHQPIPVKKEVDKGPRRIFDDNGMLIIRDRNF